jgi:hypothetical protein
MRNQSFMHMEKLERWAKSHAERRFKIYILLFKVRYGPS